LQVSLLLAAALLVGWAIGTHFADVRPRHWMIVAAAVLVAPLRELRHALAFPRAAQGTQRAGVLAVPGRHPTGQRRADSIVPLEYRLRGVNDEDR
jgi:hypothetical protein